VLDDLEGVRVEPYDADRLRDGDLGEPEFLLVHGGVLSGLKEALPRMAGLRVLQSDSAGVDWLLPVVPDGTTVCDARGVHDVPVSEWVLAAILADRKGIAAARDAQRDGEWHRERPGGRGPAEARAAELEVLDLEGATVLILGYGSIGAAVERRLEPFGVEVLRVARSAREGVHPLSGLEELLPAADIVVVLLPLTEETRGLVGARVLERLSDGALLVNAGRGPVVDTDALLAELRAGRLRAVLDVTDPEPLPSGHPLWAAPGTLITPHVAGDSPRLRERTFALTREQLRRMRDGEPLLNVVEGEY
jgi:phosphoglycerate dehydrogenase-like enzyme